MKMKLPLPFLALDLGLVSSLAWGPSTMSGTESSMLSGHESFLFFFFFLIIYSINICART